MLLATVAAGTVATSVAAMPTLVAGVFVDDVNSFCNGSAYIVTLGEVPIAATCAAPTSFAEPCVSADGGLAHDTSSQ